MLGVVGASSSHIISIAGGGGGGGDNNRERFQFNQFPQHRALDEEEDTLAHNLAHNIPPSELAGSNPDRNRNMIAPPRSKVLPRPVTNDPRAVRATAGKSGQVSVRSRSGLGQVWV